MTEIATQEPERPSVLAEIRGEAFRQQLAAALPPGITPDRFQRLAVTALLDDQIRQPNPAKQLLAADRASLYQALIKSAQDGLTPDGREAALVKRGDKVVYQPMVAGFRKIAAEYGWTVRGGAVRENDEFDWSDEPPWIKFRKAPTGVARGELVYAFAVARHPSKGQEQIVMTREEVLKRAESATTKQVWDSWPDEMWSKTAVRDLFQELSLDHSERTRLARVLEEPGEEEPASAAVTLYGSEDSAGTDEPIPPESQPPAGVKDPAPAAAAGDTDDDEPEPTPEPEPTGAPVEGEADIAGLASRAALFVPPNGKYGPDGQFGPKTLAEIAASGEDGERWIKWALGKVTEPPEYAAAVWSFARVHAVAAYQEALARKEASA